MKVEKGRNQQDKTFFSQGAEGTEGMAPNTSLCLPHWGPHPRIRVHPGGKAGTGACLTPSCPVGPGRGSRPRCGDQRPHIKSRPKATYSKQQTPPPRWSPRLPTGMVEMNVLCAHSEIRLHSTQRYARLERHLLFTEVPAGRLQLDPGRAVGGKGGVCLSVLQF